MEIAGVDFPDRAERFEVVYMLLSLTKNHRVMVKVSTDENAPVPTVTTLWPVAGWLEREVFDIYGVKFAGNPTCAAFSPITASKGTLYARISRSRAMSRCSIPRGASQRV